MMPLAGSVSVTAAGGLSLEIEAERYRVLPEDLRALIFYGSPAPLVRERLRRNGGTITSTVSIEGHIEVHPAGRAAVVRTAEGSWLIPLVSLRRVARGEAAGAPLFPISGDGV